MFSMEILVETLKIIVTASIFFVWFIRYDNIKKEFKEYGYPSWFIDLIGILKISFIIMFHSSNYHVNIIGYLGISILMLGAVFTHIKNRHGFGETIASISMLCITLFLLCYSIWKLF